LKSSSFDDGMMEINWDLRRRIMRLDGFGLFVEGMVGLCCDGEEIRLCG